MTSGFGVKLLGFVNYPCNLLVMKTGQVVIHLFQPQLPLLLNEDNNSTYFGALL